MNVRKTVNASKRRGFTLIELLVVIAIIAILAAILFPVFAQAREKARQASCESNEKQLILAVLQYTEDYDEMLPRETIDAWHADGTPYYWDGNENSDDEFFGIENAIDPYIKTGPFWGPAGYNDVWHCPSDPIVRDDGAGANQGVGMAISYSFPPYYGDNSIAGPGIFAEGDYSYASGCASCHFVANPCSDPLARPSYGACGNNYAQSVNLAHIGAPSDTIAIIELWESESYARSLSNDRYDWSSLETYIPEWPQETECQDCYGDGVNQYWTVGAHTGFTNCAYADGHVKAVGRTGPDQNGYYHPNWFQVNSAGEWNGQAPNPFSWNEKFHTQ